MCAHTMCGLSHTVRDIHVPRQLTGGLVALVAALSTGQDNGTCYQSNTSVRVLVHASRKRHGVATDEQVKWPRVEAQ